MVGYPSMYFPLDLVYSIVIAQTLAIRIGNAGNVFGRKNLRVVDNQIFFGKREIMREIGMIGVFIIDNGNHIKEFFQLVFLRVSRRFIAAVPHNIGQNLKPCLRGSIAVNA